MKKAMVDYMQNPINDELYTPEEAIKPLLPYIDPNWIIWEPTDPGCSNITRLLRENGNKCIGTCENFFEKLVGFDCIITNPPYSLKDDFLEQCYKFKKPFALLLPITALEGIRRGKMFREHGLQLLVLDKRINFMPEKNGSWFNVSWFTWGILPENLIFTEVGGAGW